MWRFPSDTRQKKTSPHLLPDEPGTMAAGIHYVKHPGASLTDWSVWSSYPCPWFASWAGIGPRGNVALLRKVLFPLSPLSKSPEPEVTGTHCCLSPVTLISYTFRDASTSNTQWNYWVILDSCDRRTLEVIALIWLSACPVTCQVSRRQTKSLLFWRGRRLGERLGCYSGKEQECTSALLCLLV